MSRAVLGVRALLGVFALFCLVAVVFTASPVTAAAHKDAQKAGKRAKACTPTLPNGNTKNPIGSKCTATETSSTTTSSTTSSGPSETTLARKRVAVVGAGASGSGAAFFLARAARVAEARAGLPAGSLLDLTVFDKNDYIGGRVKTIVPQNGGGPASYVMPIELGATIYVDANVILKRVAAKFQLPEYHVGADEAPMQIWDGATMLYTQTGDPSVDTVTSAARYGPDAPVTQAAAVTTFIQRVARLYSSSWLLSRGIPDTVASFASALQLGDEYTARSGWEWATNVAGMGATWVKEFVEARTRMNYGTDVTKIHGLGAVTSLATSGASVVAGGNAQIFQAMLVDSGATVRLNTPVSDVSFTDTKFTVSADGGGEFDAVFWANPWHLSGVAKTLEASFDEPIPPQEYVKVHVTAVTCDNLFPLPGYFGLEAGDPVLQSVLTTGASARDGNAPMPEFDVLTYMSWANEQWVVRLHSPAPLSDTTLSALFTNVTWVHRQEWDAYPLLAPTSSFPPLEPMADFHYLAALEPWLSTMETQAVSGREAAARAAKRWWGVDVGSVLNGEAWDLTT